MSDNILSITGLCKAFQSRQLLQDATLGLNAGSRIGLIGDNGAGKSTLLKIITGQIPPDGGHVALRQGTKVAMLSQSPVLPEGSVEDALASPYAELRAAIARYERHHDADDLEKIDALGGWEWRHRIERAATSVGLTDLAAPTANLSGGQKRRVALAMMLLQEPDLVLLDEPTNHLDTDTVEWLEKWLVQGRAAAMVVTHDRYFLEAVVDRMAELRQGQLRTYVGAYSDYLAARATEEALEERTQQRRSQILKVELEWARRSPAARTTKQQARLDRVDALKQDLANAPKAAQVADMQMGAGPRLGKTILTLEDVSAGFDKPLFAGLSFDIKAGERWGIVGPNGVGKTSLLRLVLGDLEPMAGRLTRGINSKMAYFDQHRTNLDPEKLVREVLVPEGGDTVFPDGKATHVASWLQRFAFASQAQTMRVAQLSGGEKNRLALAKFMLTPANVLLLDEPTNDLDLLTMAVLEDILMQFAGCVLVVSHDRYFLDKVATGIVGLAAQPEAPARPLALVGGYTHYNAYRKAHDKASVVSVASVAAAAAAAPAKAKKSTAAKLSYNEKRELAGMEASIESAEEEVARLEMELADPATWTADVTRGKALQGELEVAQAKVTELYARWEVLSSKGG